MKSLIIKYYIFLLSASDARIPKRDCQETGCDTMMDEDGYLAATDLGESQTKKMKQTDPKQEVHGYMTLNVQNRDIYDTKDVYIN